MSVTPLARRASSACECERSYVATHLRGTGDALDADGEGGIPHRHMLIVFRLIRLLNPPAKTRIPNIGRRICGVRLNEHLNTGVRAGFHCLCAACALLKIDKGIVFDVPNCELGHNGEDVSFNSILKKYRLSDPALVLLGEIVRAADSHPSNPHPAGEGLRWIAHGFSELGLSDHKILEREFVLYDALYGECKRQVGKTFPGTKEISMFEIASTVR